MPDFKYTFRELTGNQLNISILKRSINNNTFRQFSIFSGILGTGKSTCARISAMALTCESPDHGEPCCSCSVCRENIKAFENGVNSPYISVINAGKIVNRESMEEVVHNIFDLQGSIRNKVFIVEEAHALAKVTGAETMLLSELDNIAPNIYLIFSTTRLFDLKEELTSRAEKFNFSRLSDSEAKQLLVTTAEHKGYGIPDDFINLIVKHGKGIPRNLLKALDFTIDEEVSLAELRAHLQIVSDSQLLELFEGMQSLQIQMYVDALNSIKESVDTQDILHSLKSFLVQVAFVIEGDIPGTFTKSEMETIKKIFTREKYYKIVRLIDGMPRKIDDTDLELLLLHIRMIIQSRNTSAIVLDSPKVGSIEKDATAEKQAVAMRGTMTASVKPISLDGIKKLQG